MKKLVQSLDRELWQFYGNSQEVYETYNNVSEGIPAVLVLFNEQPIDCGTFKRYDEQSAELKRVLYFLLIMEKELVN